MENELKLLGETVLELKMDIAKKIHEERLSEIPEEQRKLIPQSIEDEITNMRESFISLFGKFLVNNESGEAAYDQIEKWAKETSEYLYNLGVPLDAALKDTSLYRSYITEVIEDAVIKHNMSVKTVFAASKILDPLLDHAVYCFSLTFVHFYKVNIENAKKAFIELSVPVVPLSEDIAVLPLVGNIDTERATLLMEIVLEEAVKLKLSHLILDLSGVAIVDTMVAQQIFNVMDALKLLGVKTIITGIRPEIAQTVVSLGIDFSKQDTKASLQQALSDANLFRR